VAWSSRHGLPFALARQLSEERHAFKADLVGLSGATTCGQHHATANKEAPAVLMTPADTDFWSRLQQEASPYYAMERCHCGLSY
jgi:hypothetical protein